MKETQKNRTVIFDFDGTLANSTELIIDLLNSHATMFGYLPLKREEIPAIRRMGYKKAMKMKKIRLRAVPTIIMTLSREMQTRSDEIHPFDGMVAVLEQLRAHGYSIAVVTSNQLPLVTKFFADHHFPSFDFIVSEKSLFGKARALRKVLRRNKLSRGSVVYVGDEPRDVVACRKAGIKIIGVSWGLGGVEGFEAAPPDVLVHTPQELAQVLLAD